MPTVGSLAWQVVARHEDFGAGIKASKAELRTLKDAFLESQTPVERFSLAIDHLTKLAEKFPERAGGIQRSIAAMRDEQFRTAQTPLAEKTNTLTAAMSKLGLVVDPVSLAFKGLQMGMDLARQAMQALEQVAGRVVASMQELDELAKKSRTLGIDPGSLVGLRRAGEDLAGVAGEQLDAALSIFSRRLAEAATTGKGATDTLERLGLKASDLVKLPLDQAIGKVASAMQNVQSPAERMQLSFELLGKQGAALAPLLASGAAEIERLSDRQRELSQIDWINLKNVEEANDKVGELKDVLDSIFDLLAGDLATTVGGVAGDLTDGFSDATNKGEKLRDMIKEISLALATTVDGVENLGKAFTALGGSSASLSGLAGTSAHGRAAGQFKTIFDLLQALELANPESKTAQAEAAFFAKPIGKNAEFREPREGAGVTPEEQGKLHVGRPPGVEAFEQINKAREAEIKVILESGKTLEQANKERRDAADKLFSETRTASEKLNQRFAEILNLPLDPTTRQRALEDLKSKATDLAGAGRQGGFGGTAQFIQAGTVEALCAQFRPTGSAAEDEKAAKAAQETATNTAGANDLLTRIETALLNPPPLVGVLD